MTSLEDLEYNTDEEVAAINKNGDPSTQGMPRSVGARAIPMVGVRGRPFSPPASILKPTTPVNGEHPGPAGDVEAAAAAVDDDGFSQFERDHVLARRMAFKDHFKKLPHE